MKKTTLTGILISIVIAIIIILLSSLSPFQMLENKLYDWQMTLRPNPPPQSEHIVFIEMDDEAIATLGRWPWPRNYFAHIINTLNSLGAKQILFDVTFAQPTNMIVNKGNIPFIFEGDNQISSYINEEIGLLKSKETITQAEAIWTLSQIREGFNQYTESAKTKLNNAVIDNDTVLQAAFKNSTSLIGFSFEVVASKIDADRVKTHKNVKAVLLNWIEHHPAENFKHLPLSLKQNKHFTKEELTVFFNQAQIKHLLNQNMELTAEECALALNKKLDIIRPDFNSVKKNHLTEKSIELLKTNPKSKAIDVIYTHEVFSKETQKEIQSTWNKALKEYLTPKTFSVTPEGKQDLLIAKKMDAPFPLFINAVTGGGFLNSIPDQDGVLRATPLFITYNDTIFPHIGIASILNLTKPDSINFDHNFCILKNATFNGSTKDIRIPITKNGATYLNWAGTWENTFKHVSCAAIYRLYVQSNNNPDAAAEKENQLKKIIENKICIIGLTATGTHDYNPTPYESAYPMVGTHGNLINSILNEQFITKLSSKNNTILLLLLAFMIGLFMPALSAIKGLTFTITVIISCFLGSLHLLNNGMWINLASPLILCLFSFIGITSYKFATIEKSKRAIKAAFGKYVSPDVIDEIMNDPSKLQLGGEKRTLAVQFSDIRGFTTYCEKRSPEEIVLILNEYLDAMTKVIIDHKGTLDKYVGDEIMAIWGAPRYEPPEISSKRAVIASIKMLERLKELEADWNARGLEPLDIGIGVNTGEMIVGNMGSELRMDYTVIGDPVNLGARVEALTRDYKCHFIISEFIFKYVKDMIEYEELEEIKVKGKNIPVMIYKVLGLKDDYLTHLPE
ncbi:CHASE2 domain-containing protein [Candidatus Omnitrophota bacterium]